MIINRKSLNEVPNSYFLKYILLTGKQNGGARVLLVSSAKETEDV
jgi:hypothetical protein